MCAFVTLNKKITYLRTVDQLCEDVVQLMYNEKLGNGCIADRRH